MIISNTQIALSATHHYQQQQVEQSSLTVWVGRPSPPSNDEPTTEGADRVSLSATSQKLQPNPATAPVIASAENRDPMDRFKLTLIKALMEQLTGKRFDLKTPTQHTTDADRVAAPAIPPEQQQLPPVEGWGMIYNHYQSYQEVEQSQFKAHGVVQTADGQQINIDLQLNLSRQFSSEQSLTIRAGDALKDPLVINYAGGAAELTQRNFEFDIDVDGELDQIAFLRPGSGFLARDLNQDGVVNDGSELFGALSGDGFAELAQHDQDQNGWIDANDPIYNQLRIWSKDPEGNDQLVALGLQGVGAIYLGHIETPFRITDSDNDTLGAIRQSSIFLREDGSAGTVQHLDLKV